MVLCSGACGTIRAIIPLVGFMAVQVNAEVECPSLLTLMTQSTEDRTPFDDNKCGGPIGLELFGKKVQDKVHDNAPHIQGIRGPNALLQRLGL